MEKIKLYSAYDQKNNKIEIKTVENIDDFSEVIKVFRNYPYYEILNKDEIEEEYNLYKDKGISLAAYLNDKVVGLNCICYESDENHSIKFDKNDKIAYYSGLAVKEECRGLGIGKLMVRETDLFLQSLKMFDYEYARILLKGSMSEGIFRLNSFEDVYYNNELIVDEVGYIRCNTLKYGVDERKYMVKTLTKKAHEYYRK